ncbi:MAG: hypothetical protein L0387_26420 [Acidobacteria bacterium]|nr:hypothetical protein [Acidobacteriota bacterium]MCI0717863.1 hypothetical protein [Acidobacteriota bacterium]
MANSSTARVKLVELIVKHVAVSAIGRTAQHSKCSHKPGDPGRSAENVESLTQSPIPGGSEHVVFTTPYIVLQPGLRGWEAYFRRTLTEVPEQARLDAYERHMKYGPTRSYWDYFIFEAYVNYGMEVIYLAVLPDVPESRPHSEVNSGRFGW